MAKAQLPAVTHYAEATAEPPFEHVTIRLGKSCKRISCFQATILISQIRFAMRRIEIEQGRKPRAR